MPRRNGSYFGLTANPTPLVASGIWRVREAEEYLRVNKWPATPGVPGSPTGTAGNGEVALAWSVPTLGSPPTDYQVQYSDDAGATWTTFADGTSTATSAVVTGLTNGTGYIFRVRAVNALGEGPYGAASGPVTPYSLPVSLLLHFDGSFADSSPSNANVTASNAAAINTTVKKFGSGSGYFSPNGIVEIPASAATFGSDDFSIECWAHPVTNGLDDTFNVLFGADTGGDATSMALITINGMVYFLASAAGGWGLVLYGGTLPTNEWTHVAVCRANGVVTLFVSGVAVSTGEITSIQAPAFASVGHYRYINGSTPTSFDGYIDEFRIVNGVAVYTSNFTPPAGPY